MQIKEIKQNSHRLTEDKAYILGVIGPGDGFIRKGKGTFLSVADEDFAEAFKDKVEEVYGIEHSKKVYKPCGFGKKLIIAVSFYSTRIIEDLKKYNVSFYEPDWRIPKEIKNSPERIKCSYISGFADSQGCVHRREIILASKNDKGLNEMLELIKSLSLRATKLKRKDINIISIHSRGSLEYFYSNIKFKIGRKQHKLKNILLNYKNNKHTTPRSEIQDMVPTMIKLIKKGYNKQEIADHLNLDRATVYRRLKNPKEIQENAILSPL